MLLLKAATVFKYAVVPPRVTRLTGSNFTGPSRHNCTFPTSPSQDLAQYTPPPEVKDQPSFVAPLQAQATRQEAVESFCNQFEKMKNRPAFAHPLFKTMTKLAKEGTLTKEQFSTFRDFMLARIYLTMPSIARHALYALLNGDDHMFVTCWMNLGEEGGHGNVDKMHPRLAEKAFNEIGRYFDLPEVTMKAVFDKLLSESPELKQYSAAIEKMYSENPAFASLAQETASGGNGKTGMMADLYEFFEALRPQIDAERYQKFVFPYFQEHLSLELNGNYREHAEEGVECQHAHRALEDATRCIRDGESAGGGLATIRQFAEVQENLFNKAQSTVLKVVEDL